MPNIFDYLKWRGDLSLSKDKFNEIDNLILSRFSYLPFDEIIEENEIITIREINKRFKEKDINTIHFLWNNDDKLLPALARTRRFRDMKVTKYVNKIDLEKEKQFSAITILMEDETIYVSYRGTDDTLVRVERRF